MAKEQECYVDKPMLYWVIGIALTISTAVVANSFKNQERIDHRVDKTEECILQMKGDISEIKTDIKWLNEMRKNGEIIIKNQTSFKVDKMASTTKSQ